MITFFQILHILICFFLILIVLVQAGKGHGLAGAFGSFAGGAAQNLFGARTTDVLTKITGYTAGLFLISALFLAFLQVKESKSVMVTVKKPKVVAEAKKEASEVSKKIGDLTDKLLKKTVKKSANDAKATTEETLEKTPESNIKDTSIEDTSTSQKDGISVTSETKKETSTEPVQNTKMTDETPQSVTQADSAPEEKEEAAE